MQGEAGMADEFTSRHIEGPDTGAGMVGDASGMMRYVRGAPGATTADALAALDLPAAENSMSRWPMARSSGPPSAQGAGSRATIRWSSSRRSRAANGI